MNLFVGEIFKESDKFKQASVKAIKIALYFKSSNNKHFIGQLRSLQRKHMENMFKLLLAMIQGGIVTINVFIL